MKLALCLCLLVVAAYAKPMEYEDYRRDDDWPSKLRDAPLPPKYLRDIDDEDELVERYIDDDHNAQVRSQVKSLLARAVEDDDKRRDVWYPSFDERDLQDLDMEVRDQVNEQGPNEVRAVSHTAEQKVQLLKAMSKVLKDIAKVKAVESG